MNGLLFWIVFVLLLRGVVIMIDKITARENAPDKILKYIEVIDTLEEETKYCIDNPDKAFSTEYRKGFINGLIQAKSMVTKLAYLQDGENA